MEQIFHISIPYFRFSFNSFQKHIAIFIFIGISYFGCARRWMYVECGVVHKQGIPNTPLLIKHANSWDHSPFHVVHSSFVYIAMCVSVISTCTSQLSLMAARNTWHANNMTALEFLSTTLPRQDSMHSCVHKVCIGSLCCSFHERSATKIGI